jgi:hypothetical protein
MLSTAQKKREEISETEVILENILITMGSLIGSPSGYYHPTSESLMDISKTEKGGLKVEVPLGNTCFTQIFIIDRNENRELEVAWCVKAGMTTKESVTKLITTGEEAFRKFMGIYRESRIIAEQKNR